MRSPLQVPGPWGPPRAHIDLVNVRHCIGFGRSWSCQAIVVTVSDWERRDEELPHAQRCLEALVVVRAVWEGAASYEEEEVPKTIGTICRWFS